MSDKRITDSLGNTVGYIETYDNGNKVIRGRDGLITGRYDAQNNKTTDSNGNFVAYDDQSSSMLPWKRE